MGTNWCPAPVIFWSRLRLRDLLDGVHGASLAPIDARSHPGQSRVEPLVVAAELPRQTACGADTQGATDQHAGFQHGEYCHTRPPTRASTSDLP